MDEFLKSAYNAVSAWADKTLEDLRKTATFEDTGMAYESIRQDGGMRAYIIACFTNEEPIRDLCDQFGFTRDSGDDDWSSVTLAEALVKAKASPGLTARVLNSSGSLPSSVVLISADPDSTKILERLLKLG